MASSDATQLQPAPEKHVVLQAFELLNGFTSPGRSIEVTDNALQFAQLYKRAVFVERGLMCWEMANVASKISDPRILSALAGFAFDAYNLLPDEARRSYSTHLSMGILECQYPNDPNAKGSAVENCHAYAVELWIRGILTDDAPFVQAMRLAFEEVHANEEEQLPYLRTAAKWLTRAGNAIAQRIHAGATSGGAACRGYSSGPRYPGIQKLDKHRWMFWKQTLETRIADGIADGYISRAATRMRCFHE
ncbi:hypothetical protein DL770_000242 [Monosporascus sp. CRB-9-2]|nr:hypothetical protein DL770_000242 [Monosporascus sp. CRB-9-2]